MDRQQLFDRLNELIQEASDNEDPDVLQVAAVLCAVTSSMALGGTSLERVTEAALLANAQSLNEIMGSDGCGLTLM